MGWVSSAALCGQGNHGFWLVCVCFHVHIMRESYVVCARKGEGYESDSSNVLEIDEHSNKIGFGNAIVVNLTVLASIFM